MKRLISLFFVMLFTGLLFLLLSCTNNYEEGLQRYDENNYEGALFYFKGVQSADDNYNNAKIKIAKIDSIFVEKALKDSIERIEQAKKDSLARSKKLEKERIEKIEKIKNDSISQAEQEKKEFTLLEYRLKRAIQDTKTYKMASFILETREIKNEIVIFHRWVKLVKKAEIHKNRGIQKLGKTLQSKVKKVQKSTFPKLREKFRYIFNKELWKDDVKVLTEKADNSIIVFIGATFTRNKNKAEFHKIMKESLYLLRFKKVKYKWSNYDDEYTYYDLRTSSDTELLDG
ncbi:MAG: hypothetical protein KAH33_02695 [Candidatus Delongbacteria bacterium]|nr:hypothetical protein [Candidatus Delongbacteria bacterium]